MKLIKDNVNEQWVKNIVRYMVQSLIINSDCIKIGDDLKIKIENCYNKSIVVLPPEFVISKEQEQIILDPKQIIVFEIDLEKLYEMYTQLYPNGIIMVPNPHYNKKRNMIDIL